MGPGNWCRSTGASELIGASWASTKDSGSNQMEPAGQKQTIGQPEVEFTREKKRLLEPTESDIHGAEPISRSHGRRIEPTSAQSSKHLVMVMGRSANALIPLHAPSSKFKLEGHQLPHPTQLNASHTFVPRAVLAFEGFLLRLPKLP